MSVKDYVTSGRVGIINPHGNIWTRETFDSEEKAREYLQEFWGDREEAGKFTTALVTVTLSVEGEE